MQRTPFLGLIFCVAAWAQPAQAPARADPDTYLRPVVERLETAWPENRTLNIVCHGHSVPAGYFKTPIVDTFNAYPHLVHRGLKGRFPHAVINTIVTAIGGESSVSGAARFEADVLSLKPDVVLIDYSLNDRRVGLKKAREAWVSMIETALAAGVKVILLTPTGDTRADLHNPEEPLNLHAAQVRELAREYGVGLVDSWALLKAHVASGKPLENLMSQVNHPNRKGHEMVAEAVLRWFNPTSLGE